MKTKRHIISSLILLFSICCTINVFAESREEIVYNFLRNNMGLNQAAACGVLANIAHESSFNPASTFTEWDGSVSYGICQWNGSRKNDLINYCGSQYTTLDGQLRFLKHELETSEKSAWNNMDLLNIPNTVQGASTAAYRWARYFERCAVYWCTIDKKGYSYQHCSGCRYQYGEREDSAKNVYWPKYGIQDTEYPAILDIYVKDITETGYTIHCIVTDNQGLSKVQFPTWTSNTNAAGESQDDITWHESAVAGTGWELNYRVNYSDHNNERNCWYWTDIYCYDTANNCTKYASVKHYASTGHYLDVNGYLDGSVSGSLGTFGTFDVYIDGELKANDVTDFYELINHGSRYEIKDVKASLCHTYDGVYSGSLSGTLTQDTTVSLRLSTKHDYNVKETETTCTVLGGRTYTCRNCGDTYTEKDTALLPHDYNKELLEATCVNLAGTRYSCQNCGDTYTEYASADWSDWSTEYPEGVDERYIESRTEYSYSDKQNTTSESPSLSGWTQTGSEPVYSGWSGWSAWQTDAITKTDTVDVDSQKVYRYYYFYCPVCGGREPFQGTSDCHQYTLTSADAHLGWFTVPYSQSNPQSYSYTTRKYYTTAPDGNRWNFSASNLNDTAIGTLDDGNGAVVIATGYRSRTRSKTGTRYYFEKWGEWSNWSGTAVTESSTRQVKTRTTYRYNRTQLGEHSYDSGTVTGDNITYRCHYCDATYSEALISLAKKNMVITATKANTDLIKMQGIVAGESSSVTLNTPGRVRIAFEETDVNNAFSLDVSSTTGYFRAYVVYTDVNGQEQVVYSSAVSH